MSTKGFRILWIKLQIENRKFLSIPFPIPLYIFWELLDYFNQKEPYDLVDVTADKVKVLIKIR